MKTYTALSEIIDAFENPTDMADAMNAGKAPDQKLVYPDKIGMWKRRESIPSEFWNRVIAAVAVRGFDDITHEVLATIQESRKEAS